MTKYHYEWSLFDHVDYGRCIDILLDLKVSKISPVSFRDNYVRIIIGQEVWNAIYVQDRLDYLTKPEYFDGVQKDQVAMVLLGLSANTKWAYTQSVAEEIYREIVDEISQQEKEVILDRFEQIIEEM